MRSKILSSGTIGQFILFLLVAITAPAQASIISTYVEANVTLNTDSDTDNDPFSASADLSGLAGASVSSDLSYNSLSTDTATLNFNTTWSLGTDPGSISARSFASVDYFATTDSILEYQWDFSYSGTNPFGLQIITIEQDGNPLETLGNYGVIGTHIGSDTFSLLSGNSYIFMVGFHSNIGHGGNDWDGTLSGDISFNFNEGAPAQVPAPAPLALIGLGLLGLGYGRKKSA